MHKHKFLHIIEDFLEYVLSLRIIPYYSNTSFSSILWRITFEAQSINCDFLFNLAHCFLFKNPYFPVKYAYVL